MRCINRLRSALLSVLLCACLSGCALRASYAFPYEMDAAATGASSAELLSMFAEDLCVVNSEIRDEAIAIEAAASAGLFDLNQKQTRYALRVNERQDPASLTKVMTALVALKYGQLDQTLTASANAVITEQGAQQIHLKEGDQMTLDQALHIMLLYSANDVALMIAENISGSVGAFTELMNQEAREIGATSSHFTNPHGLTQEEHYVTAYDMYLIFNAALRYDAFQQIISLPSYSTQYRDQLGNIVELEVKSTNLYLQERAQAPVGVTVIGGKTGTTAAAGHCLILLAKDNAGNSYIAVVLGSDSSDALYRDMTALLSLITN